ncbi:hypothetical protein N7494_001067 [Penicillium frequentans]|uniref:Uncharacterized protein n=1 Tax=Penicillium frequentans TaxID=3151616 RepID=A0AAD6D750_9EURO|nr:hypothetical protein N7494_001067 [Penicillium glabrum]
MKPGSGFEADTVGKWDYEILVDPFKCMEATSVNPTEEHNPLSWLQSIYLSADSADNSSSFISEAVCQVFPSSGDDVAEY